MCSCRGEYLWVNLLPYTALFEKEKDNFHKALEEKESALKKMKQVCMCLRMNEYIYDYMYTDACMFAHVCVCRMCYDVSFWEWHRVDASSFAPTLLVVFYTLLGRMVVHHNSVNPQELDRRPTIAAMNELKSKLRIFEAVEYVHLLKSTFIDIAWLR